MSLFKSEHRLTGNQGLNSLLHSNDGSPNHSSCGNKSGGRKHINNKSGGAKNYGATPGLLSDLANNGMGRGYVDASISDNNCLKGGGLDYTEFNGTGHRPIHANPGYGYVNPTDNIALKGGLPQIKSYDQNACVGGRKRKKRRKRNTKKRNTKKRNTKKRNNKKSKRKTKKTCKCKKCNCKNCKCKKKGICKCKKCKKNKCICFRKTLKRKRNKKRNNNVRRKNMQGCGLRGGGVTYSFTGKNVDTQLASPLSVPNVDRNAYHNGFSAYRHGI
jgi:hypothetical protein